MSNSFDALRTLDTPAGQVKFYDIEFLAEKHPAVRSFPYSIRVLLESVLRNEDGVKVTKSHIESLLKYNPASPAVEEIPFNPARVLLQDFTGVPCVVDLAAMRSTMKRLGGDPARINPILPVDLIIDHSVQVDVFNSPDALRKNADLEFQRNRERYEFLRWGQSALKQFSVVPPASGICHQVNLEYLGTVVRKNESNIAYFDSVIGTDSHTPMINGLSVLGWGVGGIEAEAAMLGQPVFMLAPSVVGVRLTSALNPGVTATDLVLAITQLLRKHGVVGKFVEFCGDGLSSMSVPDRATICNMAPEYGATVGYFPVDECTLEYMYNTGRSKEQIDLVRAYAKAQGVFRTDESKIPKFEVLLELDLSTVEAAIAGPKRPQDRIVLREVKQTWNSLKARSVKDGGYALDAQGEKRSASITIEGKQHELKHGDVVLAAITSCTNTSNPSVLLAAGLVARNAVQKGLVRNPWVKTSFAPGSVVVTEYLLRSGLMKYLEQLGFYLVGYGCTTCIGNSGPLQSEIIKAVHDEDLVVAGVLSGNRNFEGRINPHTKANFLMSPPLVVLYALAGTIDIDVHNEPVGRGSDGKPVYMRDIWPDSEELDAMVAKALDRESFIKSYSNLEQSNTQWNDIPISGGDLYDWKEDSTYIHEPPFFENMGYQPEPIESITDAHVLIMAGDSITTDHISPAGPIATESPAGRYLQSLGIQKSDFNSYGSRRGDDRVMTRGTFANIRFRNALAPGTEGSFTVYHKTGEIVDIFEASERYRKDKTPVIILAGKDYGMGSSRDWAAKGVQLLGVRAVIAESYERIHRSNLVGMGVLPLQFKAGENPETLGLDGSECYTIQLGADLSPASNVTCQVRGKDGKTRDIELVCRIDTPVEIDYFANGGILQTVIREFLGSRSK